MDMMKTTLIHFLQVALVHLCVNKFSSVFNLYSNLKDLEDKLKRLSCRAYDMKEKVTQEEQTGKQRTGKRKRKGEVDHWLGEVQEVEKEFNDLKSTTQHWRIWRNPFSAAAAKVVKLDKRVKELIEQSRHFESLIIIYEPETRKKLFEEGLEQASKIILSWLTVSNYSMIVIHGSRGVGKTTLAEHICPLLLESNFSICWLNVSKEFDKLGLQNGIAKELGCDLSDVDEEEVRADKLREALDKMAKRLVIILDGVLEEICLSNMGIALGEKCRLIWTTRSEELCNSSEIMKSEGMFKVEKLGIDHAWDLFHNILGLQTVLSQDVEKIAKYVASRCTGLPLAIIIVAGSMIGVTDRGEWEHALQQLTTCQIKNQEMKDEVFAILHWSVKRLHALERSCFLFCCGHLKECGIQREELINRFISEKLIPETESGFKHAQNILEKLIKVCLLRGGERVKMHGSIRATGITLGKLFKMG